MQVSHTCTSFRHSDRLYFSALSRSLNRIISLQSRGSIGPPQLLCSAEAQWVEPWMRSAVITGWSEIASRCLFHSLFMLIQYLCKDSEIQSRTTLCRDMGNRNLLEIEEESISLLCVLSLISPVVVMSCILHRIRSSRPNIGNQLGYELSR